MNIVSILRDNVSPHWLVKVVMRTMRLEPHNGKEAKIKFNSAKELLACHKAMALDHETLGVYVTPFTADPENMRYVFGVIDANDQLRRIKVFSPM